MSAPLNNPLCVPISIDAIWSDGTTNLSPPTVDFSQLKKSAKPPDGNFNNSAPWLGDTSYISPNSDYKLAAGIHLHWTLPAALCHGTTVYKFDYGDFNELVQQGIPPALVKKLQAAVTLEQEYSLKQLQQILTDLIPASSSPPLQKNDFSLLTSAMAYPGLISSDSVINIESYTPALDWDPIFLELYGPMIIQTAAHMKLPPVPNRWLVIRKNTADDSDTAWVIESDRLTPKTDVNVHGIPGPNAIPTQFTSEEINNNWYEVKAADTWQYLGFKTTCEKWQEDDTSKRLAPLTAVGHGMPDFAAFYPNCQGVFGFHDAIENTSANRKLTYEYTIIGWFSEAENDPLSDAYAVQPWASTAKRKDRLTKLGWYIDSPDWSIIDGSIYCTKVKVTGDSCEVQASTDLSEELQVTVGNTAGEALSAYLATGQDEMALGLKPESVLNASQAGVLKQATEPDGPAVIENALHTQAFQPQSSGWFWQITAKSSEHAGLSTQIKSGHIILDDTVAQALNELNTAQFSFDQTQAIIRSERQLLFTDWCRALHLETDASAAATHVFPNGGTENNEDNITLGKLAGNVVNTSAEAVKKASLGEKDIDNMLAYSAAETLYLAHAKVLKALVAMHNGSDYQLQRQPAPRYWQPNDPVMMMVDESGASLTPKTAGALPYSNVNGKDYLTLTSYTPAGNAPAFLPANWDENVAVPAGKYITAAMNNIETVSAIQSWRPLSLHWQTSFYDFPGVGSITSETPTSGPFNSVDYKRTFITDNFTLDPAGIDLITKPGVESSTELASYEGRVTLSDHAAKTMRESILQLSGQEKSPPKKASELSLPGVLGQGVTKTLLDKAYNSTAVSLSQTLTGFNARLLMLKRIHQISLFAANYTSFNASWQTGTANSCPPWDACSQSFYNTIGMQKNSSSCQDDKYNPIRAGKCELQSLQLVDAFGQIRNWSYQTNNTIISSALPNETAHTADAAPAFLLPPRFTQPSRLLFRWLAADGSNDVESNQHPATTPVCGWLALNRVDETIMIFTQDGVLIGWTPAGGGGMTFLPGKSANDISDPFLAQVVNQIQATTDNSFYDQVNNALFTIEPRAHRQHVSRSVLASRPLALARAAIRLELAGTPAAHQGYEALATMRLDNNAKPVTNSTSAPFIAREHCGFTQVEFPVRLGDVSMDDDGLVAYWRLNDNQISNACTLVSTDPESVPGAEPYIPITAQPDIAATQALLLLDPRAPVHIISGILPVKEITIPPVLYSESLKNMEYLMQVGPVLTQQQAVEMPLPTEARGTWHWLVRESDDWEPSVKPAKIDDQAHPTAQPAIIRQGYLKTGADDE